MNKTEKLICLILGAVLAWYILNEMGNARKAALDNAATATNQVAVVESASNQVVQAAAVAKAVETPVEKKVEAPLPSVPEKIVTLEDGDVKLELSTWGAVVKKVTLKKYAKDCGPISDENPPVVLDFSDSPLGAGETVEAFEVAEQKNNWVSFRNG